MNNLKKVSLGILLATAFTACKKDEDPTIVITAAASSGSEHVQFDGNVGSQTGSAAGNAVYIDFSNDKITTALRSGWDLGFTANSDFRVILNNTASTGAKVLSKFDLSTVNATDTIGLTLSTSQTNPQPTDLVFFDDINGNLNQTVIPAVSATDAANPVIILNRGTGGSIAARPWIKLRVLRNSTGDGYTVQYAGILETGFHTYNIIKNSAFNFQFLSFDNGVVAVEPEKTKWDLVWSYSVFETNFGSGTVPYNFSDLIAVNYLSGVQVKEKIYADANTATAAYNTFNRDSINVNPTVPGRWTVGSNWRSTQPATGAKLDRFYLIKDANGLYYKFKCLAMGVGNDGGTRGRPEFKYTFIP